MCITATQLIFAMDLVPVIYMTVSSLYCRFEKKECGKYEQRIREEFFCALSIFFGRMNGCAHVVYKRQAYLLSLRRGIPYSNVVA